MAIKNRIIILQDSRSGSNNENGRYHRLNDDDTCLTSQQDYYADWY